MVLPNPNNPAACPFRLLGLNSSANREEVVRAWRLQMRAVHPDKSDAADATVRAQLLNAIKERALKVVDERQPPQPQKKQQKQQQQPWTCYFHAKMHSPREHAEYSRKVRVLIFFSSVGASRKAKKEGA
jgi:hypothetical protein